MIVLRLRCCKDTRLSESDKNVKLILHFCYSYQIPQRLPPNAPGVSPKRFRCFAQTLRVFRLNTVCKVAAGRFRPHNIVFLTFLGIKPCSLKCEECCRYGNSQRQSSASRTGQTQSFDFAHNTNSLLFCYPNYFIAVKTACYIIFYVVFP